MDIAVVTGSRAEYGIMRNLISKLKNDSFFSVNIIVTGMHLEEKFGFTYKYIEQDGFNIDYKVYSNMTDYTEVGTTNSIGITISEFGKLFASKRYDAIIVLGDRYEILSACIAASINRIPIIHLHGGEKTEGNYDEFIRHSITKMSHLHLTSCNEYRNRVIQLGEQPSTVYNVGSLGVENVLLLENIEIGKLNNKYSYKLSKDKYFVIAFHPETLTGESNDKLLQALVKYKKEYKIVFIGTNSDTGADKCIANIEAFCDNENSLLVNSLSQEEYFSLVKNSRIFIGNSSSGIIEVPSLGISNVNIGDRQKGRLQANSTFNCINNVANIEKCIDEALEFNSKIENPYYKDNCSDKIIKIIKNNNFNIMKEFYDIEVHNE